LAWTNRLSNVLVNPSGSWGDFDTEPKAPADDLGAEEAVLADKVKAPSSAAPATAAVTPVKAPRKRRRGGLDEPGSSPRELVGVRAFMWISLERSDRWSAAAK
jgi:hypothetical protein